MEVAQCKGKKWRGERTALTSAVECVKAGGKETWGENNCQWEGIEGQDGIKDEVSKSKFLESVGKVTSVNPVVRFRHVEGVRIPRRTT